MDFHSIFLLKKTVINFPSDKMKRDKKSKIKKRKFFTALALGMLLVGGGALGMPINDTSSQPHAGNMKSIKSNPADFLKMNGLSSKSKIDYFEEINNEFRDKNYSGNTTPIYKFDEKELLEAVEKGDYSLWKEALEKLGEGNEFNSITKEDFEKLVEFEKENE
jgi:hypothetical protein